MKNTIILATLCVLLAGCAATVTSSTPRSIVVNAGSRNDSAGAQRLAQQECQKHGRHARMTGRPMPYVTNEFTFDCVE